MLRRGISISMVALVAAAAAVLSWAVGSWWIDGGRAPLRVGWLAGVLLLAMGAVVLAAGSRMWRQRRGRTHVPPLVAARLLGLAQASALTGAVMTGLDLGQVLALLPDLDFGGRGALAARWSVAALGALALTAAGLLVQRWCRVDTGDDEDEGAGEGSAVS